MSNQDFFDYGSDSIKYNAAMKEQQDRIAAKEAARQPIVNTPVAVPSSNCFVADEENGKYVCPECKAVEGGSKRIITHLFNCKNKSMPRYCQQGAKRSRTKKSKRSKSRSKKARKTRRSNK